MSEITLPKKKIKAEVVNPKRLIMYSPPKAGKTTLLSQLDGCLIIDLEDGSKYLDALKVEVTSLAELGKVGKAILDAGKPYKYVAIDTITKLEEWCEGDAKKMYKDSPQGKNFDREGKGLSVLSLPNGAGYLWLRQSMNKWLNRLYQLADHVILVGHLKDKFIEKDGKEVSAKDIDLTGKLKQIVCSQADAVTYLHREEDKIIANFNNTDDITCGSRCDHLKGKEITISEMDEKGNISTHWDKIFID